MAQANLSERATRDSANRGEKYLGEDIEQRLLHLVAGPDQSHRRRRTGLREIEAHHVPDDIGLWIDRLLRQIRRRASDPFYFASATRLRPSCFAM